MELVKQYFEREGKLYNCCKRLLVIQRRSNKSIPILKCGVRNNAGLIISSVALQNCNVIKGR